MIRSIPPLLLFLGLAACQPEPGPPPEAVPMQTEVVDLSAHFDSLDATFVLLDAAQGRVLEYNGARARQPFLPASTFKIANTLIALETGVATPDFTIAWDSSAVPPQDWWPRSWRQDQTLRSAFQNSVVWVYQDLARRIGPERMQAYLEQFSYGNQNIGGGIDRFWLAGDLRIAPYEQVIFLQKLYGGHLGVSDSTMQFVKDVMVLEDGGGYRLGGKTGTANLTETRELGWLVGYLEMGEAVYFYALNMEGERVWEDWPPQQRATLVKQLLATLDVLPAA